MNLRKIKSHMYPIRNLSPWYLRETCFSFLSLFEYKKILPTQRHSTRESALQFFHVWFNFYLFLCLSPRVTTDYFNPFLHVFVSKTCVKCFVAKERKQPLSLIKITLYLGIFECPDYREYFIFYFLYNFQHNSCNVWLFQDVKCIIG